MAIFLPFGGKVLSTITPGVVCAGEGPITIRPVGPFPAAPYAVTPATRRYANFMITPGSWIVGLYEPVPAPVCGTTSVPPAPVPALPIIMFGVSTPSLGI